MSEEKPLSVHEFWELKRLAHYEWMLKRTGRAANFQRVQYQSACQGKHAFTSWNQAHNTIHPRKRSEIEAYRCPACGNYHVGSRKARKHGAGREGAMR